MENAISLTPQLAAAAVPSALRRYDRVYLGSEFCANLLPTAEEFAALRARGARKITLLSALMTDGQLARFEKLLKTLLKLHGPMEVAACDLGVLTLLRDRYRGRVRPVLARPGSADFLRMRPEYVAKFMREFGIEFLETDEAGMVRGLPPDWPGRISFNYPLRCAALTRLCAYEKKLAASCSRGCGTETEKIAPKNRPDRALLLRNNGYFWRIKPCRAGKIGRLVYSPLSAKDKKLLG